MESLTAPEWSRRNRGSAGSADWLAAFERIGRLYEAEIQGPAWARLGAWATEFWPGVALFVVPYAFERQGRRPDYPDAAADALARAAAAGWPRSRAASAVWDDFQTRLKGQGLNVQNNPLAPRGTVTTNGRATRHLSAIEVSVEIGSASGRTLPAAMLDHLRVGETEQAYEALQRVNGVGPKIASFFLRDLATQTDAVIRARHLLQPVDVWVRRGARRMLPEGDPLPDADLARALVAACADAGTNAELVNMGLWYAGARVLRSEYRLANCPDPAALLSQADGAVQGMRAAASAWHPISSQ